jgi:hypothetical protein
LEPRRTPVVSFAAPQTYSVGFVAVSEVSADFNGDGRPDLAVLTSTPLGSRLALNLNTTAAGAGTSSFAAGQIFAVGSQFNSTGGTVAVGDFNGDGRPDLVVTNGSDNTVSVLVNTTPPGASFASFAAEQTFAVGTGPDTVAVGDFNSNGRPDLAITYSSSKTVSVMLNTTPAGSPIVSFAAAQTFAVGNSPFSLAVADFNGDGRADLAVANYNDNTVSILLNTTPEGASTSSFVAQRTFATGAKPLAVAAGEFNGDGRPDLAVANSNDKTVSVLLNTTATGAATASFAGQQSFAVGSVPEAVVAADPDGDGRPDLAVANRFGNTVSVLVNTTPPGSTTVSFAGQQTFAVGNGPVAEAAGDFNGDGRTDLAVTNLQANTEAVLLNTTTPFATTVPAEVGQFGSQGVWQYNRFLATWVQLTASNSSLLAADSQDDIVAEFPGFGVWEYRASVGWKQLNGIDATQLATDALGDVVAEFPGYGVGEFLPAVGWRSLTPANASLLAMDALGDVAADFPGYGVELFRPSVGWKPINGVDANLLAMDPKGDIVANFPGYGVGEFLAATGWKTLTGAGATALAIDARGDVAAEFKGHGIDEYLPASGWHVVAPGDNSHLALDDKGDLVLDLPGDGVWEFDLYRGWFQLTGADASLLAVA